MEYEYEAEYEALERKEQARKWLLTNLHPSDPDYPEDEDDSVSGSGCLRSNRSDCGSDSSGADE